MILNDIKIALRVNSATTDTEINDLIESARFEMKNLEIDIDKVNESGEMDPLIKRAITFYCKGHYGYDNAEAERFVKSYQNLRDHLSLSSDYKVVTTE